MGMSSWRFYFSRPQPSLSSSWPSPQPSSSQPWPPPLARPASAHIPLIGQGRAGPRSGQNTPEEGLIPIPKIHSFTKHPSQAERGSANCPRPRRLSRRWTSSSPGTCLTPRAWAAQDLVGGPCSPVCSQPWPHPSPAWPAPRAGRTRSARTCSPARTAPEHPGPAGCGW